MRQRLNNVPSVFSFLKGTSYKEAINAFITTHRRVLSEKYIQVQNLNNMVDIDKLSNNIYHDFIEFQFHKIESSTWGSLTSDQRTYLRHNYNILIDKTLYTLDIVNTNAISDSIYLPDLILQKDIDFTISNRIITFFQDPYSVTSYRSAKDPTQYVYMPKVQSSIYIPDANNPVTISTYVTLLYCEYCYVYENWYYKRLGVLLNLSESDNEYVTLATYQMYTEGVTTRNLSSFLYACGGYPIALSNETVTSVESGIIETDKHTYIIPDSSIPVVVEGSNLSIGDPLFDFIEISTSYTDDKWWELPDHRISILPNKIYSYPNYYLDSTVRIDTPYFFVGFPSVPMLLSLSSTSILWDEIKAIYEGGYKYGIEELTACYTHSSISYNSFTINPVKQLIQEIYKYHLVFINILNSDYDLSTIKWDVLYKITPIWTYYYLGYEILSGEVIPIEDSDYLMKKTSSSFLDGDSINLPSGSYIDFDLFLGGLDPDSSTGVSFIFGGDSDMRIIFTKLGSTITCEVYKDAAAVSAVSPVFSATVPANSLIYRRGSVLYIEDTPVDITGFSTSGTSITISGSTDYSAFFFNEV